MWDFTGLSVLPLSPSDDTYHPSDAWEDNRMNSPKESGLGSPETSFTQEVEVGSSRRPKCPPSG